MAVIKGAIGICSGDVARYSIFYGALVDLAAPEGTIVLQARGGDLVANCNNIVERALATTAEWIWFVEDDHVFGSDVLTKLVARNVDVVGGLYLQRHPPFAPVVYDRENSEGAVRSRLLKAGEVGLKEVIAIGAGALCIRRRVWEALGAPWWRSSHLSPDVDLCRRIRAAGFKVHVDLDVPIGHSLPVVAWPVRDERTGVWVTSLAYGGDVLASLPAAHAIGEPAIDLSQVRALRKA